MFDELFLIGVFFHFFLNICIDKYFYERLFRYLLDFYVLFATLNSIYN